ncbi:hypothetical protein Trydic_g1630 [Trypoxylus dichotomus]
MFPFRICLFLVYPICLLAQQTCFQNFYWRDFIPGTIPYDALLVQNSRYIGQVQINRHNVPGTIIPHGSNSLVTEFGGRQIHKINIQILCSPELQRFYWEKVDFTKPYDEQMKNSVKGGFQVDLDYYIGAALDNGEIKIGRVIPIEYDGKRGLYIWHPNGQVKILQQFFLLKYNPTNSTVKVVWSCFMIYAWHIVGIRHAAAQMEVHATQTGTSADSCNYDPDSTPKPKFTTIH